MKYIKRCIEGVLIVGQEQTVIAKSLKGFLNQLCLENGSSYQGRINSMKHINNTRGLVPLFVNHETVFLFSRNIRESDVVLVNQVKILSMIKIDKSKTKVIFDDMDEIILNISTYRLKRQMSFSKTFMDVLV